MIRLATVGTSNICKKFLSGMVLTKEFELRAVYSRKYETGACFAKDYGVSRIYTNLEELAKCEDIDAVYIASPNAFHTEQSRVFLENGKHVICEKPIATRYEDYRELKKLADSKSLIYMEAMISRHNEDYVLIKDALKQIGNIVFAKIDYCQRSSRLDSYNKGEKVNIFDMSLHAGTLMDLGIYCVSGAVDLLGMPNIIKADKYTLKNGADGAGYAIFDYGSFPAVLTYCKTGAGHAGSEIVGDKGTLKIDMISQYAGVTLIKDNESRIISDYKSKAEQMRSEAQHFANYILRYEEFEKEYDSISKLTHDVQKCMDIIKKEAGLIYPEINKE